MAGRTTGPGFRRCGTRPIAWARCSRSPMRRPNTSLASAPAPSARNSSSNYGSPFAVETAHIKFKDSDLSARIIRSLFDTARQYRESIDVYGSKKSFEWTLIEHEPHVLHTAKLPEHKIPKKIQVPDYAKRLPKGIRQFTTKGVYDLGKKTHLSFTQGAGHGGSHPHLAHEFVTALVEDRDPYPERRAIRQLDLRRPLRSRIRPRRRQDREAPGLYAMISSNL